MGIVSAIRRQNTKISGTDDAQVRTIKEQWIVTTEVQADRVTQIFDDPKVPQPGDPHPDDPLVTLKRRSVKNTGSDKKWLLDLNYDNKESAEDIGGGGGGPIQVLNVKGGSWLEEYTAEQDINGKFYRNSAGDKIKRVLKRPQPLLIIQAQTDNPQFFKFVSLEMSINSQPVKWLDLDLREQQLMFYEYDFESLGNGRWRTDFVFRGRRTSDLQSPSSDPFDLIKGWQPQILDAGFNEIITIDGQDRKEPIYETQVKNGKPSKRPVRQEWPLDGDGGALSRDEFDTSRIYLDFDDFPEIDFSIFQFDFASLLSKKKQRELENG